MQFFSVFTNAYACAGRAAGGDCSKTTRILWVEWCGRPSSSRISTARSASTRAGAHATAGKASSGPPAGSAPPAAPNPRVSIIVRRAARAAPPASAPGAPSAASVLAGKPPPADQLCSAKAAPSGAFHGRLSR